MKYRGATGSLNGDPMAVALAADGTLCVSADHERFRQMVFRTLQIGP